MQKDEQAMADSQAVSEAKPQPTLEPESQAQEPEAADIPIDEETGKPLAGVELAKWRRQQKREVTKASAPHTHVLGLRHRADRNLQY